MHLHRRLPAINSQQAKILFDALQSYQEENASLIHGWTLTDNASDDVELFTGTISIWGMVEELKNHIKQTFPENPAN
jgi:hypothetical protein